MTANQAWTRLGLGIQIQLVLRYIGYDGWLTVEAFGNSLPNLVAATKIWRPLFESEGQLAREAYSFLRASW